MNWISSIPQEKRDVLLCIFIFSLFTIPVFFYEYPLINPNEIPLFITLKVISIFGTIFSFALLYKNPYNQPLTFVLGLFLCLYGSVGEYFSPLYFLSFVQCILGFMLLLRPSRKTFLPITAFGWIPIIYIKYLKEIGVITHAREPVIADYVTVMLAFTVLFIAIFEGFSKKRRQEIEYREKFSLIGENSNIIAHNIKSILSTQFIIVDNLKDSLGENKEELKDLEENLNATLKYLHELNTFARNEISNISLRDSISKIASILNIPYRNLQISGDNFYFESNVQDVETILLNLFSNAKKSISANEIVEVSLELNRLSIRTPLNKNYQEGSGIGLEIVRKLCLKNKIRFTDNKENSNHTFELIFKS